MSEQLPNWIGSLVMDSFGNIGLIKWSTNEGVVFLVEWVYTGTEEYNTLDKIQGMIRRIENARQEQQEDVE